jgi:nucleoside-diphosphate-sugar epimerase
MRILITGGGGMLGQMLARTLLDRGGLREDPTQAATLTELVLLDQGFPQSAVNGPGCVQITCEVTDLDGLARASSKGFDAVFHLAAVVSAGAEADFDLGVRVNVDGLRAVLEICRRSGLQPRVVFVSSVAAFGGELPEVILDTTAATPQSSYGTQKVIGELLVADMTRKGYIDGRTLRLPTIVIRPGKPNRAASGFMSNILREPLNGESAVCPVAPETQMWILSPERAIAALIHAAELPASAWGWNRTLNAPGITVSVAAALEALARIAGRDAAARVRFEPDAAIQRIVLSWPARFAADRAERLGFGADADIDAIIRAHLKR